MATHYPEPIGHSIADACRITSFGKTKMYELINAGDVDVVRIGRRTIVKADSLRRLLGDA